MKEDGEQSEKCFPKGLSNVPILDGNVKTKIRVC